MFASLCLKYPHTYTLRSRSTWSNDNKLYRDLLGVWGMYNNINQDPEKVTHV